MCSSRLCTRVLCLFMLWAHATASVSVGDDESYTAGTCAPESPLLLQALGDDVDRYINSRPLPSDAATSLKHPCMRWREHPTTCCTADFFEFATNYNDHEAQHLSDVRDVYLHLVEDWIAPLDGPLSGVGVGEAPRRVQRALGALRRVSGSTGLIVLFLDRCEDSIRRLFTALLCELCDPGLMNKSDNNKLRLSEASVKARLQICTTLHTASVLQPRKSAQSSIWAFRTPRPLAWSSGAPHG